MNEFSRVFNKDDLINFDCVQDFFNLIQPSLFEKKSFAFMISEYDFIQFLISCGFNKGDSYYTYKNDEYTVKFESQIYNYEKIFVIKYVSYHSDLSVFESINYNDNELSKITYRNTKDNYLSSIEYFRIDMKRYSFFKNGELSLAEVIMYSNSCTLISYYVNSSKVLINQLFDVLEKETPFFKYENSFEPLFSLFTNDEKKILEIVNY